MAPDLQHISWSKGAFGTPSRDKRDAVEALPELLKTPERAAGMTVDQIASGKSALAGEIAKIRKGSKTLPKQELNSSLSL